MDAKLDLNLLHLQAELARIDVLIRREVRRWQLAGQNPTDDYRGLYVSDADADGLLARPLAGNWGNHAALEPAEAQAFADEFARAEAQAQTLTKQAQRQKQPLRLRHLAEAFGLDRFDLDVFLVCMATTLDLRYERLYGYLQDDVTRKRPSINLILDLLSDGGLSRLNHWAHFGPDAPLFKSRLLERIADSHKPSLLTQTLYPSEAVVTWLMGHYQPPAELGEHATLATSDNDTLTPLADILLPPPPAPRSTPPASSAIHVFTGPDTLAQEVAAQRLASQSKQPLLSVNLAEAVREDRTALRVIRLAARDARLTGALLFLQGWDSCFQDGAPPPDVLAEACTHPGPIILAGRAEWQARGLARDRGLQVQTFPIPSYAQRKALWQYFLLHTPAPTHLADAPIAAGELNPLAGQFNLNSGQIRDAVMAARDAAALQGEDVTPALLFAAARAHSNPNLAALARKIVPRYGWDDIILPEDQRAILRELIATVRGRPIVLEEWGVGRKLAASAGVTVLFAGPPGTGKTMSAEIIASELGLDLYKIDLSTMVSKYIGETEKNLERVFKEAETSNAILFFDEADAVFGKRSEVKDAHDRYANIEISYLLQRMEAYDGVTILATNLRANMDEAFKRRLQFVIDFPFPDEADRLRIWQTLFPVEVPRADDVDLAKMAKQYKLAGGSIRNIIVSAAYLAASNGGKVTMEHLLHGTRREMQKMGRLVGE